jgi:hypothetical protein
MLGIQTELVIWIIVLVPRPPRMPSSPPPCFLPLVVGRSNTDVTAPSSSGLCSWPGDADPYDPTIRQAMLPIRVL